MVKGGFQILMVVCVLKFGRLVVKDTKTKKWQGAKNATLDTKAKRYDSAYY